MLTRESIFNKLFEENMSRDLKLKELNKKIFNLENEFKEKYGNKAFWDYCKISELMLEELLECVDLAFRIVV